MKKMMLTTLVAMMMTASAALAASDKVEVRLAFEIPRHVTACVKGNADNDNRSDNGKENSKACRLADGVLDVEANSGLTMDVMFDDGETEEMVETVSFASAGVNRADVSKSLKYAMESSKMNGTAAVTYTFTTD
ncbi:MAG: hypothetical protein BWY28_01169 [bacterium ADurb.Bin236]|nr:MAG: hypothetical protein BWY28_01169 [bacterium ADurb.Bin236]HOY64887.1 hypothetical protein [bacterium]HPN93254.1 hypothetical protein [bacterium]